MDLGLEVAAKMFLQRVANQTQAQVFVAVHVRRMDYSVWLKAKVNGRLLSKLYFIEAMNAFRAKYRQNTVVFVLASDDKEWCRQMFADVPDVVFTPKYQTLMKRGEFDMAILAQCNHSIIRYLNQSLKFESAKPPTAVATLKFLSVQSATQSQLLICVSFFYISFIGLTWSFKRGKFKV